MADQRFFLERYDMRGLMIAILEVGLFGPVMWIAVLALVAAVPRRIPAQQLVGDAWIGKRVMPKSPNFKLWMANQVVVPKELAIYRVKEVNGPRLLIGIDGRGLEGWVMADEVVPIERAIEFFTNSIESNPGDPRGYVYRATVWHREKKDLEKALVDYTDALRLIREFGAPDHIHSAVLCWRGIAWSENKDYDRAIADFTAAIRINPSNTLAYNDRAWVWIAKREFDKAVADCTRAIRIDRRYPVAYNNRGRAWQGKKELDKAIKDYTKAIELDPYLARAHYNRGNAWKSKRDYAQAIADYNKAIRIDPSFAFAYINRAWIWATCPDEKLRDGKRAIDSATQGCDLSGWKLAPSLAALAAAYAESGDFESAVRLQEKAQGLYEDDRDREKGASFLELYRHKKPYRDTTP